MMTDPPNTLPSGGEIMNNQDITSIVPVWKVFDHLGSVRVVLDRNANILQQNDYYPFGLHTDSGRLYKNDRESNRLKFNGKEQQSGLIGINFIDYGARFYAPTLIRWTTQDPLAEKYTSTTPYNYCVGNPINLVDADGKEPELPYAGTVADFISLLNNSPRKVGYLKGNNAADYLQTLGNTEWSWSQFRPLPTQTGYFNKKRGRYIYTEKGGWIDMAHFMFYAGRAYKHKQDKAAALELIKNSMLIDIPISIIKTAFSDPVGEALQEGFLQEKADLLFAPHSAYSYEDLPSDKLGAIFGAKYFDANSEKSFGEQLADFLRSYGAVRPEDAPNYKVLPESENKKPSRENYSTTPVYTKENP